MQDIYQQRKKENMEIEVFRSKQNDCKEIIERFQVIYVEKILAMVMGLHGRLGSMSWVGLLDMEIMMIIIKEYGL